MMSFRRPEFFSLNYQYIFLWLVSTFVTFLKKKKTFAYSKVMKTLFYALFYNFSFLSLTLRTAIHMYLILCLIWSRNRSTIFYINSIEKYLLANSFPLINKSGHYICKPVSELYFTPLISISILVRVSYCLNYNKLIMCLVW